MSAPDDVLVVGAGPVGLALALDLARRGRRVRLLEARATRPPGSRAIGIHPPGLAVFERLGLLEALVAAGTPVRRGRASGARGPLGSLDFDRLPPPFPFVLTVPQPVTEGLLSQALARVRPGCLERGARVERVEQDAAGVTLHGVDGDGAARRWRAVVAVGCDGRESAVRSSLGIAWRGGAYGDRYAMADLPDGASGVPADEAWIALHAAGVVEGFPLPGGVRRWVVRVHAGDPPPDGGGAAIARWVAERVVRRTGVDVPSELVGGASVFAVERWLAGRFASGRVALAGDAAHVVSPIGGQGMNLGWLDAAALADAIDAALPLAAPASDGVDAMAVALAGVGRRRRALARRAVARAAWNTRLGRPHGPAAARVRDAVLARLLRPPWASSMLGRFTMRGLG